MATPPRTQLHCHLLGVISPQLLRSLRAIGEPCLVDPDELARVFPIRSRRAFECYVDILRPYQRDSMHAMRPVLAAHASALLREGIAYAELMISPSMFPEDDEPFIAACREWRGFADQLERSGLILEFLMVVPRSLPSDRLERDVERFLELHAAGLIAGVALVGAEGAGSLRPFERAFGVWRDAGLGIEAHAGEHQGPEAVWEAIRCARPHRLGHALGAFRDPELLKHIERGRIHLELCLTSNLCTGAVAELAQHPLASARDLGLSYSIETDDPGAFECSIESERSLATRAFGLSQAQLAQVDRSAERARFGPAGPRRRGGSAPARAESGLTRSG